MNDSKVIDSYANYNSGHKDYKELVIHIKITKSSTFDEKTVIEQATSGECGQALSVLPPIQCPLIT